MSQSESRNKVADALSHWMFILTKMSMMVNDFEKLKTEYESCLDFCDINATLKSRPTRELDGYTLHEGYLFQARKAFQEPSLKNFLSENCTLMI